MGRLSKVLVFVVVLAVAAAGVALAANRIGDNTANTLTGTANPDAIYGLGMADTLNGLGGNDELSGNNGSDTINGGDGNDIIVGGPSVDKINAGTNTFDDNSADVVDSFDGRVETVCLDSPIDSNWFVLRDTSDTIVGPPNCSTVFFGPKRNCGRKQWSGVDEWHGPLARNTSLNQKASKRWAGAARAPALRGAWGGGLSPFSPASLQKVLGDEKNRSTACGGHSDVAVLRRVGAGPTRGHLTPGQGQGPPEGAIPGRYIVVFDEGEVRDPTAVAREHAQRHGAEVLYTYQYAIEGYAARLPEARLDEVRADGRVAYLEPDQTMYAEAQTLPWGIDKIDADLSSTKAGNGSGALSGVNAYVIDTGIYRHTDLNRVKHVNFVGDGRNTDCHGHGTHVAGTVAAKDNTSDVVGVAPGAPLTGVKVLGCNGSGAISGVIKGVDWVTANARKPAIANMSLGGGLSQALDDAVRRSAARRRLLLDRGRQQRRRRLP